MSHLIRAELQKLTSIRMFWGNVLAALAFVPLSVALAIYSAGDAGHASLQSGEGVRNVLSAASAGSLLVVLIGIVMVAGEYRHGTATGTFLVTPDRRRVVLAKLATASLVGVALALAASLLCLAVALPWLSARHVAVSAHSGDVAVALAGALAANAIAPLLGVGIGALVRNQTLAVLLTLGWSVMVESLLVGFAPGIGRWLPGGAASALTGTPTAHGGLLPVWGAALVLCAYGAAFAAAGMAATVRRDVA